MDPDYLSHDIAHPEDYPYLPFFGNRETIQGHGDNSRVSLRVWQHCAVAYGLPYLFLFYPIFYHGQMRKKRPKLSAS